MKLYFTVLFILFTFVFSIQAQSYDITVQTDSDENALNVLVDLAFITTDNPNLGNSNVQLDYDEEVLANPTLTFNGLSGDYTVEISTPVIAGANTIASINATIFSGAGTMIPAELTHFFTVTFDVIDPAATNTNIVVFDPESGAGNVIRDYDGGGIFGSSSEVPPGNISDALGASLPIELSSFEVAKRGENSSILTWTTELEQNSSHFEIERSYSATNFDYVGSVSALGESKETVDYDFVDSNIDLIPNQNTIVYYRLKMIDNDGSFEYSEVKNITFGQREVEVEAHPNPTVDFITLTANSKITGVTIMDIDGKIIRDNVTYESKLDLTNLNSGMYKILIYTENGDFIKSVVKVD
jgi:hypothetical protein